MATKIKTPRWGWALTGSGHFFKECLAMISELDDVDLFVSKAASEVVRMYRQEFKLPKSARVFQDKTASAAPVGAFYYGVYHTLVVGPATSNTVAKCVYGISDTLVTNVFAQAGKCRVPAIVFACDTAPELETEAPKGMVKVYPRRIDLEEHRAPENHSTRRCRRAADRAPGRARAGPPGTCARARARTRARKSRMTERILFLTGHLARARLEKVLEENDFEFTWAIVDIGVKVAALMTEAIIARRLPRPVVADRIIVPGRCRADLERLTAEFGIPFERGPDELKDLPAHFGRHGRTLDLSRHDMRMFVEIVDASAMTVDAIVARATEMRTAGADVIDLGCLPDTPFPHLEDAVRELKVRGFVVSVDSANADELRRGGHAGADFLLSLTEHTLDVAADKTVPSLIPATHSDMASLLRAAGLAARHQGDPRSGDRSDPFRVSGVVGG